VSALYGFTLADFGIYDQESVLIEHCFRDERNGTAILSKPANDNEEPEFRHLLVWRWNSELPILYVIMLNPSVARAFVDDQTMKKVIQFARQNGFGGVAVANLSDWRSTNQTVAKKRGWPKSRHCSPIIRAFIEHVPAGERRTILLAWGNGGPPLSGWLTGRSKSPNARFVTLGITKPGRPEHPCMIGYDRRFQEAASSSDSRLKREAARPLGLDPQDESGGAGTAIAQPFGKSS